MTMRDRARAFAEAFPDHRAAHPYIVEEDGREVLYAVWLTGAKYKSRSSLYGAFPPRFLMYLLALFPDVALRDVLHAFAGEVGRGPWTRLDVNPERAPELVGNVYDAPRLVGARRFRLAIADPPYSAKDAKEYGTPGVDSLRATTALGRILEPDGFLAWLATDWPMHTKRELVTVGRIFLVGSTKHRFRGCTLFARVPPPIEATVPAPCAREAHCGNEARVLEVRTGDEATTRETACTTCGTRGVVSDRPAANLCLVYLPPRIEGDVDAGVPSVRASGSSLEALLARMRREGWDAGRWFIEDSRHQATAEA